MGTPEGSNHPSMEDDKVTNRAIDMLNAGYRGTPLAAAAETFVHDEEAERRSALQARAEGVQGPLDVNLFPPEVFDGQGERLMRDGRYLMTKTELRLAFEREDSRW